MSSAESVTSTSSVENNLCRCSGSKNKSEIDNSEGVSHDGQELKSKKSNSLSSLAQNLRRGRSLNFTNKRLRKSGRQSKEIASPTTAATKKSPKWVMKFNCTKKDRKCAEDTQNVKCCVCTCYRKTEENQLGAGAELQTTTVNEVPQTSEEDANKSTLTENASKNESLSNISLVANTSASSSSNSSESSEEFNSSSSSSTIEVYGNIISPNNTSIIVGSSIIDLSRFRNVNFQQEDCDEQARLQRAKEIAEGVDPPANFRSIRRVQLLYPSDDHTEAPRCFQIVCSADTTVDSLKALFQSNVTLRSSPLDTITGCHTQVDYVHCLVPDMLKITNSSFYWGKMDRYEAERLIEGKPEGTFLLRDSAQEEFLFSVSFRKYMRSLHARIEQWNHGFSFDSHDPSVFASDSVCGLIEHYKDPSSCMFFEPMLTLPLHRNFPFSLQHLCRAVITSRLNYDSINLLQLPKSLKSYLKEYHYRQKVRVERYDEDLQWIDLRNVN